MRFRTQKLTRMVVVALFPLTFAAISADESETEEPRAITSANRLGTPIYELLAYRPEKTTHISELDDELIVAQIALFDDEEQANLFLKNHSTIYISGLRVKNSDKTQYIVYIGLYEDDDTARWAHESFAERNPRYLTSNFKRVRLGDLKSRILRD